MDLSELTVRPIEPADADRLVRFHATLSLETTRLRFFTPHPRLTQNELLRFTTVDHHDREALVTLHGDDIVAVGRYDRTHEAHRAEVAFVVTDAWQGRGVGPMLLRRLVDSARAVGITCFIAHVLPENQRMLDMFAHADLGATRRIVDGVVLVEIPFPGHPPA
jgi:RimJ/RimL family protein N-acetyltransferase